MCRPLRQKPLLTVFTGLSSPQEKWSPCGEGLGRKGAFSRTAAEGAPYGAGSTRGGGGRCGREPHGMFGKLRNQGLQSGHLDKVAKDFCLKIPACREVGARTARPPIVPWHTPGHRRGMRDIWAGGRDTSGTGWAPHGQ